MRPPCRARRPNRGPDTRRRRPPDLTSPWHGLKQETLQPRRSPLTAGEAGLASTSAVVCCRAVRVESARNEGIHAETHELISDLTAVAGGAGETMPGRRIGQCRKRRGAVNAINGGFEVTRQEAVTADAHQARRWPGNDHTVRPAGIASVGKSVRQKFESRQPGALCASRKGCTGYHRPGKSERAGLGAAKLSDDECTRIIERSGNWSELDRSWESAAIAAGGQEPDLTEYLH